MAHDHNLAVEFEELRRSLDVLHLQQQKLQAALIDFVSVYEQIRTINDRMESSFG